MNKLFEKWKWSRYVVGGIVAVLGLVLLILTCLEWAGINVSVMSFVGYIIAIALLIIAGVLLTIEMVRGIIQKVVPLTTGMLEGVLILGLSAVAFAFPNVFIGFLPVFLGTMLLAIGVIEVISFIFLLIYNKNETMRIAFTIVTAVVCLALGTTSIALYAVSNATIYYIIMIIISALAIYIGVTIILAISALSIMKKGIEKKNDNKE